MPLTIYAFCHVDYMFSDNISSRQEFINKFISCLDSPPKSKSRPVVVAQFKKIYLCSFRYIFRPVFREIRVVKVLLDADRFIQNSGIGQQAGSFCGFLCKNLTQYKKRSAYAAIYRTQTTIKLHTLFKHDQGLLHIAFPR